MLVVVLAAAVSSDAAAGAQPVQARHPKFRDGRLEPGEKIFAIVVQAEPRAYCLTELGAAGSVVHDSVASGAVDIGSDGATAHVAHATVRVTDSETTTWSDWSRRHPDTSLWHPVAVAEAQVTRPTSDVRVTESRHYRTVIGCALSQSRLTSPNMEAPGLVVISGTIRNVAATPVDHVVLRYELLDGRGRVVFRDEGFNRSAEDLAGPKLTSPVVPLAAGATDAFRMILLEDELPDFKNARVSVARIY